MQAQYASQLIEGISRFEDTRDLRAIGGYRPGSDAALDRALDIVPRLYDALKQDLNEAPVEDVFAFLTQSLPNSPRSNSPPHR
jgi:flagellum-specific ATP synthase